MRTRFTHKGLGALIMLGLTMAAAAQSGNNLLYLLYSAAAAAFIVSWYLGRKNMAALSVEVIPPPQVFRDQEFRLTMRLRSGGTRPSYAVWAVGPEANVFIESANQEGTDAQLKYRCRFRGANRIDDLVLSSSFPFGLLIHRKTVSAVIDPVLPKIHEIRSASQIDPDLDVSGSAVMRKSRSGDITGVREHGPSDDVSEINWKLTAKTGRRLMLERVEPVGSKMTVRVDAPGSGSEAEAKIDHAASACRYFIDSGCDVRLQTPECQTEFGRGLNHLDLILRLLSRLGEGKNPRASVQTYNRAEHPNGDEALQRTLLFAAAAFLFFTFFLIDEIKPATLLKLLPILPVGWFLQRRAKPLLPSLALNLLSLAVLIYSTQFDWRYFGITLANTHLIIYLLTYRLLNPLQPAFFNQMLLLEYLAFFLVSGQTISPWYFLAFLAYFGLAALSLVSSAGMRTARSCAQAVRLPSGAAVAISALLFMATPRFESYYRNNPIANALGLDKLKADSSSVTGFSDQVSLGFFGQLKKSSARVMRIRPAVLKGAYVPVALHVRGSALDTFDGRRWSKSSEAFEYRINGRKYQSLGGRALLFLPAGSEYHFPSTRTAKPLDLSFNIFPMNTAIIFSVGSLAVLEGVNLSVGFDHTDSVYLTAPYSGGIQYRTVSDPANIGYKDAIVDYDELIQRHYLQLPPNLDERIPALAWRITSQAATPREKAARIESYLQKNYSYSTFSEDAHTDLADFLFSVRRGNCEYFATAGVVLLRLSGIPSRIVTGFLAQEWNEYGRFYDVRQSAAHAWAEAYIDGRWVTIDPTPPAGLSDSMRGLTERLSHLWDAAEAKWYMDVIGYDTYVQRNTFRRMSAGLSFDWLAAAANAGGRFFAGAACVLLFVLAASRLRRRTDAPKGYYEIAQAALERSGIKRSAQWTAREYADSAAASRPGLKPFPALVDIYYRERFGKRILSGDERAYAESLLKEILTELQPR